MLLNKKFLTTLVEVPDIKEERVEAIFVLYKVLNGKWMIKPL